MRLQMHSTDPELLEPRLGSSQSKGCIRIPASLNRFIDRYGILDAPYERAIAAGLSFWVLSPTREPTPWSGEFLVVIETRRDHRPDWSPAPRRPTDYFFHDSTSGFFRAASAGVPAGTPTMIGATGVMSAGIDSSDFTSAVRSTGSTEPMQQLPRPRAHAASIRFSAASQQSASTNGPSGFAQMTINVPAS